MIKLENNLRFSETIPVQSLTITQTGRNEAKGLVYPLTVNFNSETVIGRVKVESFTSKLLKVEGQLFYQNDINHLRGQSLRLLYDKDDIYEFSIHMKEVELNGN